VIDRLLDGLAPGGYLMLGHAESLIGATNRTRNVGPGVYIRLPDARTDVPGTSRRAEVP
jgi:chemotaxis methyl-accepting protein methylase